MSFCDVGGDAPPPAQDDGGAPDGVARSRVADALMEGLPMLEQLTTNVGVCGVALSRLVSVMEDMNQTLTRM